MEISVAAVQLQQLRVRSTFDDAAAFQSNQHVTLPYGRQSMREALSEGCGRRRRVLVARVNEPQVESETRQSISVFPIDA